MVRAVLAAPFLYIGLILTKWGIGIAGRDAVWDVNSDLVEGFAKYRSPYKRHEPRADE